MNHPKSMFQLSGVSIRDWGLEFQTWGLGQSSEIKLSSVGFRLEFRVTSKREF